MSTLLWVPILLAAFAACVWGGRMLSHHYNDPWEVAAALVVGLSVLGPIALASQVDATPTGTVHAFLAVACGGGLFLGYGRAA